MNDKKHRVEYGDFTKMVKASVSREFTEIDGVKNYVLQPIYAPVLDRAYLNKFNPKATCISLCGEKAIDLKNETEFINQVISIIEKIKEYYFLHKDENIFEYSLFDHFNNLKEINKYSLDNLMLDCYTIDYSKSKDEYYVILWFTPEIHSFNKRKHLFWYGKLHDGEWY